MRISLIHCHASLEFANQPSMLVALTIQYSSNLCLLSSKTPFRGNIEMELIDYKITMKFLIDKLTIF